MLILIAYLLGILTALKPKDHAGHNSDSSNTTQRHLPPDRPVSEISIPPTEFNDERASKKNKERRKTVRFVVEIVSAIILLFYLGVTILIWYANKKSADAAKQAADAATQQSAISIKQLEISERAWVKATYEGMIQANVNGPLIVPFRFDNTGHTPAFKPHGIIVVKLLKPTESLLIGPDYKYSETGIKFGIIFQGEGQAVEAPLLSEGPSNIHPVKMTAVLLRQLQTQDFHLVAFGNLFYDDAFGQTHWMKFCVVATQGKPGSLEALTGKVPFAGETRCNEYNDTDKP